MSSPSITETPNELTTDIDVVPPLGIVRLLRNTDAQIYNGYRSFPALCDPEVTNKMAQVIEWASPLMGKSDAAIVVSGAGTSGRLAMFAARTFNGLLKSKRLCPNFHYLMAGSNLALIKAQEKAEDDPHTAWTDIKPIIEGKKRVLYIGITCAFAAPYVASQLWHLSARPGANCVLLGFNPTDRARDIDIEDWDKTFADVVNHIAKKRNCVILNPILGPEPITGSTRMKSGSATKLILETIFGLALAGTRRLPKHRNILSDIHLALDGYERTRCEVYRQQNEIAKLILLGGNTLRHGGNIYYLGQGTPGILGIIDASECPPTFGAGFEDVRGFLLGGWSALLGPDNDLSKEGIWYRISIDDFQNDKLERLSRNDLVVALPDGPWSPTLRRIFKACRKAGATTAFVQTDDSATRGLSFDAHLRIRNLPPSFIADTPVYAEYATKLAINALTTGAHILCGKIYENRMVDLRISNTKLYYRTLGIIQSIMGVSADAAKEALLRSLYRTDRVTSVLKKAKPSAHVEAATNATKVVPRALVLAGMKTTWKRADDLLRREPIVRAAVARLKESR